jgi:hypothetical protein
MNTGRHYGLFSQMAGVRSYGTDMAPVVEPRGLPEDVGHYASNDNFLFILDEYDDDEGCCSKQIAERWVSGGSSKYSKDGKRVTNPDWHSHSWLTADEFEKSMEGLQNIEKARAMLASMR